MASVTWLLGREAIVDPVTAAITVVAAFLLIRFRVNSTWLVLAGAIVGLVANQLT
jgi:chromate transporter